jgi:hypothetical protein
VGYHVNSYVQIASLSTGALHRFRAVRRISQSIHVKAKADKIVEIIGPLKIHR